jgi:low affinity Fe/Cu permease
MKNLYHRAETVFEKITGVATRILGSSITFTLAAAMVLFWWSSESFYTQDTQHVIRDIIHGLTFLSLFILQKESNRFSGSLHLKINELVASHRGANNAVINAELKTEHEIIELVKEYTELAVKAEELAVKAEEKMNNT